jgi:RNA polymerase sigma-70 factor (ECF subfamily)
MTTPDRYAQALVVGPVHELAPHDAAAAETLRALFDLHAVYVWNTLRRLGVPASDIEDVTHEVFIQVHHHLDQYDPARPVRPWLFAFAFRLASNSRRRAYRRRETYADVDAAEHPGVAPDEQVAIEERQRLVIAALQAVPAERRAVFVLYELDETPIAEVAAVLGIPVNTAYSRLRAARAEFATAVQRLQRQRRAP